MAIVLTRSAYAAAPVLTLSLLPGGSLPANTTLYYRVASTSSQWPWYFGHYTSPPSAVVAITTTATDRTVRLTVAHATGNPEYTLVWCSEGVDPGTGNWGDGLNYPNIRFLGNGSLYQTAITGAKLTTVDDDGATYGWISDIYRIAGSPNYGFSPLYEHGRDYLVVDAGSPVADTTFEEIYQAIVAAGWPTDSTIEKDGRARRGRYIVHCQGLRINTPLTDSAVDVDLDGASWRSYDDLTLGEYDATTGVASDGPNLTLIGHGYLYGSLECYGTARLQLYDAVCRVAAELKTAIGNSYGANVIIAGSGGYEIRDFAAVGVDSAARLDTGLDIRNAANSSGLYDVRILDNRYQLYFSATDDPTFERCTFGNNVRVQAATERTFRDLKIVGTAGSGTGLWLYQAISGSSVYVSKIRLINAEIYDYDRIYWYKAAGTLIDDSYVDEAYSVNLRVVDASGNPLSGASVSIDGGAAVTTGADGTIAEQVVVTRRYRPDISLGAGHYQVDGLVTEYGPHTITVTLDGYQTWTWQGTLTEAVDWDVVLAETIKPQLVDGVTVRLVKPLRVRLAEDLVVRLEG